MPIQEFLDHKPLEDYLLISDQEVPHCHRHEEELHKPISEDLSLQLIQEEWAEARGMQVQEGVCLEVQCLSQEQLLSPPPT